MSRSPRASPETSQSRSGMRRPAGMARNQTPGRRPGNTALPPLRAERANAPMSDQGARSCAPSRGMAKAGSEPKNRRGGAPKGGHPRRADCVSGLRGMQGRAISPCGPTSLAREGCLASTRAPVGAPLPRSREGTLASLGGYPPRENDDACSIYRRLPR
jgi:hypothetical protein